MKNNKNYCKFVSQVKSSQVKSSQVKSSVKIISLIALFILLFSISCKSKQDPTPSKEDLVGTWKSAYEIPYNGIKNEFILNIDSEGNLIFNCGLANDNFNSFHYNFAGKLADTFEYPYTIELTFTASSLSSISCYLITGMSWNDKVSKVTPESQIGKFTFHDASTLTASVLMLGTSGVGGGSVDWYYKGFITLNFTKQ